MTRLKQRFDVTQQPAVPGFADFDAIQKCMNRLINDFNVKKIYKENKPSGWFSKVSVRLYMYLRIFWLHTLFFKEHRPQIFL